MVVTKHRRRALLLLAHGSVPAVLLACGVVAETASRPPTNGADAAPPAPDAPVEEPDAPVVAPLVFGPTCDHGEGDTELTWEPVAGAMDYEITWPGGQAYVKEPAVRLTGPPRDYRLRARMQGGLPGRESQWGFYASRDQKAGDTLLLRGRRDGQAVWEPISCIERRLTARAEDTLSPNASPAFGPGTSPPSLVGSAALLPNTGGGPTPGDLLAATDDGVFRFARGGPWAPVPVPLAIAPASPGAMAINDAASYVARADGSVVRQSHFFYEADASAPDVLTSSEFAGRRIFGIVPAEDGAWVLAANDGTPHGRPSEVVYFDHLVQGAVPTVRVAIPDDSASPDYRFDAVGFAVANRNGTGAVHVASVASGALVWERAPGSPGPLRSFGSSAKLSFVVDGDTGNRLTAYARLDFREALFVVRVPDASELEVVGFTEPYDRPSLE